MRALAIGMAVAIGARFGRKVAIFFGFCLLLTTPLKAQIWFGDTTFVTEQRQSRGVFYLDTLTYIGHKKVIPDKPWVFEVKPTLIYWIWWEETSRCQEVWTTYKQYKKFRWFAVNAQSFGTDAPWQIGYGGYFLRDSVAFYIAYPNLNDKVTITHEMSHGMQFLTGDKIGHYDKWYGKYKCGFNYPADPK